MNAKYRNSLAGMAALAIVFTSGIALSPKIMPTHEKIKTPSSVVASSPAPRRDEGLLANQLSEAFEEASEKVSPSVVPIFAEQTLDASRSYGAADDMFKQFFGDEFFKRFFGAPPDVQHQQAPQVVRSMGSGVIVSSDGYVLTNNHVVQGADKLTIVMGTNKKYTAKVIGTDPQSDIAVIKLEGSGFQAAQLGNSDEVKVGQWVIAVGNPFQLLHTVTAGIISAKGRSSVGLATYEDFIQTDASINPGNSGGALADLDGRVIGINTAIVGPSGGNVGIGFAIPISMAKQIMQQLIEKGTVTRGYIGILPQDIDDNLAKAMKLKTTDGALVGDVTAGGPGEKGGLLRGDIITHIDNQAIKNSTELRQIVAQKAPGSRVALQVIRDGHEMTVHVKLIERPNDLAAGNQQGQQQSQPKEQAYEKLGMDIQDLTPDIAKQLGYENDRGALVANVAQGSPADDANLQRGDLIKEVNRTTITSVAQFNRLISDLSAGDSAALLVRRGSNTFFAAITMPK
ncbi:DegQ family serine endoprotease [candidate division KSB1 bacterium]|nr:DegQ family serine endoprotease [candidate division KSB1 bacterium]